MERKITKITTWGGGKGLGYVKVYRLAFTEVGDNTLWSDYKEGEKTRVSLMSHTTFIVLIYLLRLYHTLAI